MGNKENIIGKIKTLLRFSKAETSSADTSEGTLNTFASSSVDSDQTQGYLDLSNYSTTIDSNLSLGNQSNSTSGSMWPTWSQSWPSTYSIPMDNSYLYEEFLKSLENYINDKLEEIEDKVKDLLSMIKENPKEYSNSLYPLMQYQIGQKESLLNISKYIKENKERISL